MRARPSADDRVQALRRAVRITAAATVGFLPLVYWLDAPVAALYALFTPIALGALSPLPGSGRDRASLVVRALPWALGLVALGTALAVSTAAAVGGMLVVGFVLSFGAAGGPRPAAAAPGLQLFYILASFPPYAPDTLPERLAGVLVGGVLLVTAESLLLPAPAVASCRLRLAEALDLAASAAVQAARRGAVDGAAARRLRAAGQELRMSRLPPSVRPAGVGRTDRALAQTAMAVRRLLDQLAGSVRWPADRAAPEAASALLLREVADACRGSARALRGRGPAPGPAALSEVVADFLRTRASTGDTADDAAVAVERRRSAVLAVAVPALIAQTAVAVGAGAREVPPGIPREQFWYADEPTVRLWLRRLAGNMTAQSVVLQSALRTAAGLGAARLVAGTLDLQHGFWVLLAVLTLGRTTVRATWSAVRAGILGTFFGASAAGLLVLGVGDAPGVYAMIMVPLMLLAFAVGPVAGTAWAQGLFTVLVATAFAQLSSASWRIAETRMLDVLTGCAVGLLCGVLAWPAGARKELRRSVSDLLRSVAPLVPATAGALVPAPERSGGDGGAAGTVPVSAQELDRAVHRLRLAEAAYAQCRSEPGGAGGGGPDWLAALNSAVHVLIGARWLPRLSRDPTAVPGPSAIWAREAALGLQVATVRAASFPPGGVSAGEAVRMPGAAVCAGPALPVLTDLENWFAVLAAELEAVGAPQQDPGEAGADGPARARGTKALRAPSGAVGPAGPRHRSPPGPPGVRPP